METKICTKCKQEKSLGEFHRHPTGPKGRATMCKFCCKEKYYTGDKKEKRKTRVKEHYQENKQEKLNYQKKYNKENRSSINRYLLKFRSIPSNRIAHSIRTRIYEALKKNTKSDHTEKLLGCTFEFLKSYLESKFKPEMSWSNYGLKGWHIDHIIPCASFDLTKIEEQKKCFHYTNLQPLWAFENFSKSKKVKIWKKQ